MRARAPPGAAARRSWSRSTRAASPALALRRHRPVDLRRARAVPLAELHKTYRGEQGRTRSSRRCAPTGLRGALEYYDCHDRRRAAGARERARRARRSAPTCRSYTEVDRRRARRARPGRGGARPRRARPARRRARDRARVVVAAGPWTDEMLGALGLGFERAAAAPDQGRPHRGRPRDGCRCTRAITHDSPRDGRVMFAHPVARAHRARHHRHRLRRRARRRRAPTPADVDVPVRRGNALFPGAHLGPDDVIATWAGLRPLIARRRRRRASRTCRASTRSSSRDEGSSSSPAASSPPTGAWPRRSSTASVEWLRDRGDAALEGRDDQAVPHQAPAAARRAGARGARPRRASTAIAERLVAQRRPRRRASPSTCRRPTAARRVGGRCAASRDARAARAASTPSCRTCGSRSITPSRWTSRAPSRTCSCAAFRSACAARDQGLGVAERVAQRMAPRLGWTAEERRAADGGIPPHRRGDAAVQAGCGAAGRGREGGGGLAAMPVRQENRQAAKSAKIRTVPGPGLLFLGALGGLGG